MTETYKSAMTFGQNRQKVSLLYTQAYTHLWRYTRTDTIRS